MGFLKHASASLPPFHLHAASFLLLHSLLPAPLPSPALSLIIRVLFIFLAFWSSAAMKINARSKIREYLIKVMTIITTAAAAATEALLFKIYRCTLGPKDSSTITKAINPLTCSQARPEKYNSYFYSILKVERKKKKDMCKSWWLEKKSSKIVGKIKELESTIFRICL